MVTELDEKIHNELMPWENHPLTVSLHLDGAINYHI
jgi:hypothetical protein